ncbi:E3 ubiquitin-protein ligase TRIM36-like [Saccostrea echinata]|uniref:E3 ubiquitin-protein ligase TRIM36-like n=1 Tax=Saccostrea echinata TaxID=191078 RepID=UPI002A822361|nr:E3 ubiquitin-protein ligase TRIM36-like [Saccostrea echinata]
MVDTMTFAQDVLRCDLCETPIPSMHCDFCHIKLCKACVGEHLSDLSKEHKVVRFKDRGSTLIFPECTIHMKNHCQLFCEDCDCPLCLSCLSSNSHKGHTLKHFLEILKSRQNDIDTDIKELQDFICPIYEEISLDIIKEKQSAENHYKKLKSDVTKQGADWHKEIDILVKNKISNIEEMTQKHLETLNEKEFEINQNISKAKQVILDLKKMLDSNDVSLVTTYKSCNAFFRTLPPKVTAFLPSFSFEKVNREQISQLFGSLSTLSFIKEKHGYTLKALEVVPCPPVKPLLDDPEIIGTIDTGYKYLNSVSCLSDEEIWTCGNSKVMKLYNLHGKLLRTIQTKSKIPPREIAVTENGELVYIDEVTQTINLVKNKQIEEVIRLMGWIAENVCVAFSGDLLVTMARDTESKIVRYSGSSEKQTIQFDHRGKPLFPSGSMKYIAENRNLDVCVADIATGAVIVVNQIGKLRFRYTGHPCKGAFYPHGIATDSQSQIVTTDSNNHCVHILDENGKFLRYIDNCNLSNPWAICVNSKDNLFVAEQYSGKVKQIKYI